MEKDRILTRKLGVMIKKIDSDYYVYYQHSFFKLNWTAAKILALCNGQNNVYDISEMIYSLREDTKREKVESDVNKTLRKFEELDLIS